MPAGFDVAFTLNTAYWMVGSDLLNPADCELRPSNMDNIKEVGEFQPIEHWCICERCREIARVIVVLFAITVIAPIGVCWHTGGLIVRTVFALTCCCENQWDDVERHAIALAKDLFVVALAVLVIGGGVLGVVANAPDLIIYAMIGFAFPIIAGINAPEDLLDCLVSDDEFIPVYAAYQLKKQFGLVAEDGSLLAMTEDGGNNLAGQAVTGLLYLYEAEGQNFVGTLFEIYEQIPVEDRPHIPYPPTSAYISATLRIQQGRRGWSDEQVDGWQRGFEKHERNIARLGKILTACCEMRRLGEVVNPFPFAQDLFNNTLNSLRNPADYAVPQPQGSWGDFLDKAVESIKAEMAKKIDDNERNQKIVDDEEIDVNFRQFRDLVLSKPATPQNLIEGAKRIVLRDDKGELLPSITKLKHVRMYVHSDRMAAKHPALFEKNKEKLDVICKQADAVFLCYNEAFKNAA